MHIEKIEACGNDYLILEFKPNLDYSKIAKKLCDRVYGLGAYGLIIVKTNPLEMISYNSNGQLELANGSAVRCFCKYVFEHRIVRVYKFDILTKSGTISAEVTQEIPFMCKTNVGKPNFTNQMIYVSDAMPSFDRVITVEGRELVTYSFNLEGVNTVIMVHDFDESVVRMADKISNHKLFNRKTTVTFVKPYNKSTLEARTYHKDYGWVSSSDSGAGAAFVTAYKLGLVRNKVDVKYESAVITVDTNKKDLVNISGVSNHIYTLEYNEEELC